MQMFQILKHQNNLLKRMRGIEILPPELFFEEVQSEKEKKAQVFQNNESQKEKGPCPSSNRNELENEILEKADVPLTENVSLVIDCPSISNSKTNVGPSKTNVGSQQKENALCRNKMLAAER